MQSVEFGLRPNSCACGHIHIRNEEGGRDKGQEGKTEGITGSP